MIGSTILTLRRTLPSDLDYVMALESAPENRPFVGQWDRSMHLAAMESSNFLHLVAEDVERRPVGYVIMTDLNDLSHSVLLKRIVIEAKGRGYGHEVMRLVKRLAFEQLGAHRLWLDVIESNPRAKHLYETEGFRVEGLLRESFYRDGKYQSKHLMAILGSEHEAISTQDAASATPA